jgi:hypothetical protein
MVMVTCVLPCLKDTSGEGPASVSPSMTLYGLVADQERICAVSVAGQVARTDPAADVSVRSAGAAVVVDASGSGVETAGAAARVVGCGSPGVAGPGVTRLVAVSAAPFGLTSVPPVAGAAGEIDTAGGEFITVALGGGTPTLGVLAVAPGREECRIHIVVVIAASRTAAASA